MGRSEPGEKWLRHSFLPFRLTGTLSSAGYIIATKNERLYMYNTRGDDTLTNIIPGTDYFHDFVPVFKILSSSSFLNLGYVLSMLLNEFWAFFSLAFLFKRLMHTNVYLYREIHV